MGNTSTSPSNKIGANWSCKLNFDPEADVSAGDVHTIGHEWIKRRFNELVDVGEDINNIYAYKHPLSRLQATQGLSHHRYIVFDTKGWWWSIEKNTECICIQRSKLQTYVEDYYQREKRTTGWFTSIEQVGFAKGEKRIRQLIEWLYDNNELNKPYNVYTSNCQHFSKAVFDFVAEGKTL